MSLQNLLLGLGTALIAGAVVVFVTVTWHRLDAVAQGIVLAVVTGVVGCATAAAARRRMPATAEALGLVTVVLALADAHALRIGLDVSVDSRTWWSGASLVVSAAAWWLGERVDVRSTRIAAVIGSQIPLPLLLWSAAVEPAVAGLALLAQAGVVYGIVFGTTFGRTRMPVGTRVAAVATTTYSTILISAVGMLVALFGDPAERSEAAVVLFAAAVVGAQVAWLRRSADASRGVALLGTSTLVLWALGSSVAAYLDPGWPLAVVSLAAASMVVIGRRVDVRWGREPALVGAGVGVLGALVPVGSALVMAWEALGVVASAWQVDPGRTAVDLTRSTPPDAGVLGAHLLALGAWTLAMAGDRRLAGAALTAWLTAVLAPLVVPGTPVATVGGASATMVGFTVVGVIVAHLVPRLRRTVAAGAAASASLALAWAAAAPAWSLTVTTVTVVVALAFSVVGRRDDDLAIVAPAGVLAVAGAAAVAAMGVVAAGEGADAAAFGAGAIGLLAGVAGALLLDPDGRRRSVDGAAGVAVEWTTWALHGWVLAFLAGREDLSVDTAAELPPGLRLTLACGALAAAWHATRPGRRSMAVLAVVEGLLLTWTQLDDMGVAVPEAYTLPVAVVFGGVGLFAHRRGRATVGEPGSWVSLGPALVVAFAPTVFLGLTAPGLVRPIAGVVAGAAVLVLGAVGGRRVAVDVGAAVVVLLGLRQVVPVVGGMPTWIALASTGAALVAVGATFEQRRRDLVRVRSRYDQLI